MEKKFGYNEFSEVFFDSLSTLITNEEHIEQNQNFYQEVIHKSFELYQKEDKNYTMNEILNLFHIFLYAMFLRKPKVTKPEDKITLKY